MSAKREKLQVINDILKAIRKKDGKIKPTHILYKANLSSQMLNEYLGELIKGGFVIENIEKKGKTYSLTQKGFDYLNQYSRVREFIETFGLA
jgi:predicted transcriptional regulator